MYQIPTAEFVCAMLTIPSVLLAAFALLVHGVARSCMTDWQFAEAVIEADERISLDVQRAVWVWQKRRSRANAKARKAMAAVAVAGATAETTAAKTAKAPLGSLITRDALRVAAAGADERIALETHQAIWIWESRRAPYETPCEPRCEASASASVDYALLAEIALRNERAAHREVVSTPKETWTLNQLDAIARRAETENGNGNHFTSGELHI